MGKEGKASAQSRASAPYDTKMSTPASSTSTSDSPVEQLTSDDDDDDYDDSQYTEDDDEKDARDPQTMHSDNYRHSTNKLIFKRLNEVFSEFTKPHLFSIRASPPYTDTLTRAEHNRQCRAIWAELRKKVVADTSIPDALFDPPRTYICVAIVAWPREDDYCCPCDLVEDRLKFIEIRVPKDSVGGITKDVFLEQVGEAFYGRDEDEEHEKETGESSLLGVMALDGGDAAGAADRAVYRVGGENDRPVIERFDYMISEGAMLRHFYAMTRGIKAG